MLAGRQRRQGGGSQQALPIFTRAGRRKLTHNFIDNLDAGYPMA